VPSLERGTQPVAKRMAHGKSTRPVSSTLGVIVDDSTPQQISTFSDSLARSDSLLSDAVGGQHKATPTSLTSSSLPMGAGSADSGSEAEPQCSTGHHCAPAALPSASTDATVAQQEPTVAAVVVDAPATASNSHQTAKPPPLPTIPTMPLTSTCDVTCASEGVVAIDDEVDAVGAAEEPAGVVETGDDGTTTGPVAPTSPEGGMATVTEKLAEIEIPGILVGVVIGKGGESIRRLMDLSGAKMQMVAQHVGSERNYMLPQKLRVTGCVCVRVRRLSPSP
jgi:hypothetical protein